MKRTRVFRKVRAIISFFLSAAIIFVLGIPIGAEPGGSEGAAVDLKLECRSAILVEASTGKVLYEQEPDVALPPASVTKIMTLLLVMEAIEDGRLKYTDKLTASANACSMGGSQIFLEEGEEMSVEDLVKSVVIASANDAAVVLAEAVGGTESAFVEQMNRRAQELGMKNSRFENTNGLDDTVSEHLTSARDIAIMSAELIKYPKICEYSSIWMDSIRNGEFGLTNTNRLVRFYKGATGLKTGSTAKAGFCISATATRDGMTLIAVIMGSPTRDVRNSAATSLLDYGFSNFKLCHREGGVLEDVPVKRGETQSISLEYRAFSCVLSKSSRGELTFEVDMQNELSAPIKKGEVLGQIVYKIGAETVGKSDILARDEVGSITFFAMIMKFLSALVSI